MTIKDIARIAGVSPSTVSKILNSKDQGIREETRQHVLRVAKEYQYSPYAGVKSLQDRKKYLLGLVCPLEEIAPSLLRAMEQAARESGYNLVLYDNGEGSPRRNAQLVEQAVDGLIYMPGRMEGEEDEWRRCHVPIVTMQGKMSSAGFAHFDYDIYGAGRLALDFLSQMEHLRIALLVTNRDGVWARELRRSLEGHYSRMELPFDGKLVVDQSGMATLPQTGATAVICETPALAVVFRTAAEEQGYAVPREMSILCLREGAAALGMEAFAAVELDVAALAQGSVTHLVDMLEQRASVGEATPMPGQLWKGKTVCPPERSSSGAKPILVVGSLNEDVMLNVPALPGVGETALIDGRNALPGGKGANQAVCIARLGGNVQLIGRIGNDPGGKILYSALRRNGVNTKGISVDREAESGKAYLSVGRNGESFIQVFAGANARLEARHIERNENMFAAAQYCLVQTELKQSTVQRVLETSRKHQTRVICKPCGIEDLPAKWLQDIYILTPNEKEAGRLGGEGKGVEDQALAFRRGGCPHVIITLGVRGCYYLGEDGEGYFPAYQEPGASVVDSSGACDAFIGALALRLTEGNNMTQAIRYAHVAAGISVTRPGVQPSLPDRAAMELRRAAYMEL